MMTTKTRRLKFRNTKTPFRLLHIISWLFAIASCDNHGKAKATNAQDECVVATLPPCPTSSVSSSSKGSKSSKGSSSSSASSSGCKPKPSDVGTCISQPPTRQRRTTTTTAAAGDTDRRRLCSDRDDEFPDELLYALDLGFQGSAFTLDDSDISVVEQCTLDFLRENINGNVVTECVTVTYQLATTLEQTRGIYTTRRRRGRERRRTTQTAAAAATATTRKLGSVLGPGSSGVRIGVTGRCRCNNDAVKGDAVNAVNRRQRRRRRRLARIECTEPDEYEGLLKCLKDELSDLFDDVVALVAQAGPADPCDSDLSDLQDLITCLNNNYIVKKLGEDPVLSCSEYRDLQCRLRIGDVLDTTGQKCIESGTDRPVYRKI